MSCTVTVSTDTRAKNEGDYDDSSTSTEDGQERARPVREEKEDENVRNTGCCRVPIIICTDGMERGGGAVSSFSTQEEDRRRQTC